MDAYILLRFWGWGFVCLEFFCFVVLFFKESKDTPLS